MSSKKKHSYVDMFEGIIIGGAVAAAAATFIFATKKGKALQKQVVHQYRKFGRTTKKMRKKIENVIKRHMPKKSRKVARRVKRHTLHRAA